MKELKSVIKREKTKIYLALGIYASVALLFTVLSVVVSLLLFVMVLIYGAILYPIISNYFEVLKLYKRILMYATSDPDKALKYLNSEIEDIDSVLNVQKSEMDVHALNATNEDKAMRASRNNEAGLRRRLGLFKRMALLIETERKHHVSTATVDAWDV